MISKYLLSNRRTVLGGALLALSGMAATAVTASDAARPPFVLAPMVEGFGYCNAGLKESTPEANLALCAKSQDYGVADLSQALDQLEPGGAKGGVQVGYTYGINLLTLQDSASDQPLVRLTKVVNTIERPVVLYLFANHLATTYSKQGFGAASLALFSDQTAPSENYFGGGFQPLTLDMDPALKLNQVRATALKMVGEWYKGLSIEAKSRIVAITMAGELHHYFDDFNKGMGRFDNIRVTDYSPKSIHGFRVWLGNKYKAIDAFNRAMGTNMRSFDAVRPPSLDARSAPTLERSVHFDSFAHGILPIEGWLQTLRPEQKIKVYLDGVDVGTAEYGLSRQDVYEVVSDAPSAQVGFRYELDFSKLVPGKHLVQVMVEGPQGFDLGQRQLTVLGAAPASEPPQKSRPGAGPTKIRHSIDVPANDIRLLYNPLAREWYAYRSHRVAQAYDAWFDLSVASGLPKEKLYSHQIAASMVGGWNALLFASDESIKGPRRYKKGINLYGGAANMKLLRSHYLMPGEPFGVPEFHSQTWKDPAASIATLNELKAGGARFVSPYFISMVPDKYRSKDNAHNKFRISPDNSDYGSDHLYRAIQKVAHD